MFVMLIEDLLGLNLFQEISHDIEVLHSEEVQKLIELRQQARECKNWQDADRYRDALLALGYKVVDKK